MPGSLRSAIWGAWLLTTCPAWAGGVLCEPPYYRPADGGPYRELCEAQAAARRFLDRHNLENRTDWEPIGPDQRIVVPACLTPLRATWTVHENEKSVLVTCIRSAAPEIKRKWTLHVHVFGKSLQQNYFIREAAKQFIRRENVRLKSNRIVWNPSDPPMVPKCEVPLAVRWHTKNVKNDVDVICRKAVNTAWGKADWRVTIPVI